MNPNAEEIAETAENLYEKRIRSQVDPAQHGKIVAIDIDSGDFEVGEDTLSASRGLRLRRPNGRFYAKRIGSDFVYSFSGPSLHRAKQWSPERSLAIKRSSRYRSAANRANM